MELIQRPVGNRFAVKRRMMKTLIPSIIIILLLCPTLLQAQKTYKVGDTHPLGGIVFQVSPDGKSGLIADAKNAPEPMENWDAAMEYCSCLGEGWYLPSKVEMRTMVKNLNRQELKSKYFWTSTEKGNDQAYIVLHQSGILDWPTAKSGNKNYVRPVRSFSPADEPESRLVSKPKRSSSGNAGSLRRKKLSANQTLGHTSYKRGTQLYYGEGAGEPTCLFTDSKGRTIIGGNFHFKHEGKAIDNLAVWENNNWTTFSSSQGEQKPLGQVKAIVEDSKNNIYVISQQVGTDYKDDNTVRMWDGNKWTTIATVNGSLVTDLAISPSDELYVCGAFESLTVQGHKMSISNVAKYQNGTWKKVGSAGKMMDIAVNSKGVLHGLNRNGNVMKYSGGGWITMAKKDIYTCYDLAFDSQDNLYVTGYFGLNFTEDHTGRSIIHDKDAQGNSTYFSNVAKYDGKTWSNLDAGLKDIYDNIAVYGNEVYFIASQENVKKWDGNSFSEIELNASYIYGINFDNKGNLIAIGNFNRSPESATDSDKIAIWLRD